jgi:hypothetical protein
VARVAAAVAGVVVERVKVVVVVEVEAAGALAGAVACEDGRRFELQCVQWRVRARAG